MTRGRRAFLSGVGAALGGAALGCRGDGTGSGATPSAPKPAASPGAPAASAGAIKVVTYNVLADADRARERFPALWSLLGAQEADIIALQEVTDWIARDLHGEPWAASYRVATIDGAPARRGGQYVLTRAPSRDTAIVDLPGRQRRTALFTKVELPTGPITVATTHAESFLEDGPTRAQQLEVIFGRLAGSGDALVLGDFNFGDGEPEEARVPAEYVDLWRALRPDEPGFTWDIERSEMARVGSFPGEPSRRLDRIYLRSQRTRGRSIEIIGDQPVHPGRRELFPSDHFGLAATLEPVSGS